VLELVLDFTWGYSQHVAGASFAVNLASHRGGGAGRRNKN